MKLTMRFLGALALLLAVTGAEARACNPNENCERSRSYPCPTFSNPGRMCKQTYNDPICLARRQACHVGTPSIPTPSLPSPRLPTRNLCETDCFAVFKTCVNIPGRGRTCNVNPAWYPLYQTCKDLRMTGCAAKAIKQPFYGNWCGKGNVGGRQGLPPIDDLDAACMRHDKCYEARIEHSCYCDAKLAAEATNIARSSRYRANTRQVAEGVAKLFGTATTTPGLCIPR